MVTEEARVKISDKSKALMNDKKSVNSSGSMLPQATRLTGKRRLEDFVRGHYSTVKL